jgi:hypothetical protein
LKIKIYKLLKKIYFILLFNNKMNNNIERGFVNGMSCSYVRLGRYNNCANKEAQAIPDRKNYVYKGNIANADQAAAAVAGQQNAPVFPPSPATLTPTVAGETFRYPYNREGFDPTLAPVETVTQAPTPAGLVSPTYVPGAGGVPNVAGPYSGVAPPVPNALPGPVGPDASWVPHYSTPNYPPINTNSLTHGVAGSCSSHFNILTAYGQNADNCVTNFIQN